MEEKFTIKVNIADRYYPLRISRADEEQVRGAAKRINDTILQYRKTYHDKDNQDFLAMALLQFVNKLTELEVKQNINSFVEEIEEIKNDLDFYLQKEDVL
jgi:hypothetical protein